jgi:hypothetical protein
MALGRIPRFTREKSEGLLDRIRGDGYLGSASKEAHGKQPVSAGE